MRRVIPTRALVAEAVTALGRFNTASWPGQNQRAEFFSTWVSGAYIDVMVQNGFDLRCSATSRHFLRIIPQDRAAYFYENCGLSDKRREIEINLRARGYQIQERDYRWFSMAKTDRKKYEREVALAA